MTDDNEQIPNWFLWLWDKGALVLVILLMLFAAVLLGAYSLGNRLEDIESQLNYLPPSSYQPPNLDDFDASDVLEETLPNKHVVYVPVYSHIYYQGGSAYPLETTLSIRNVDPNDSVFIKSVQYYDTSGKLAKTPVDRLIKLGPLQTIEFLVQQRDSSGGSGANFLVTWMSESEIDKPLIETVMVGTTGTQGISFGRMGIEINP